MKYELPSIQRVRDVRLGRDMSFDAWWYTFMAENNIEHTINPEGVASPEQLRFMAALDDDQIYVPCSDAIFRALVEASDSGVMPRVLRRVYAGAWRLTITTIESLTRQARDDVDVDRLRRRMMLFCRLRLRSSLALGNILPSRLVKRLMSTVLNLNEHQDPWVQAKREDNAAMAAFLTADAWRATIDQLPPQTGEQSTMSGLRHNLDMAELTRLVLLSSHSRPSLPPEWNDDRERAAVMESLGPVLEHVFGVSYDPAAGTISGKTLLFVGDSEGGAMADLALLKALARQGHRIILALKDNPLFKAATFWDCETDPVLAEGVRGLPLIGDQRLSKNGLLRHLAQNRFIVINDGTSELLNLYRVSTTFARAWKECDAVIVKGRRQVEQLLGSSTEFTRDILCYWRDQDGRPHVHLRPRAEQVVRFRDTDLMAHADAIINTMRQARAEGKTVMFYSCIIGSLPGETHTAITVANEFVTFLRDRLDQVLIINPAEHFVTGMDADDLMFMWERVQRSGLIQTWRFQTADDIEQSFALMRRKVPPIWAGKDATYSTGCTKEMRIALDMQRSHPEMQILGPAVDKFFRRGEYGVGKFYDAALTDL